jgi:hypothetical protein
MERCAFCKAEETMLYESGVPICLKCAALREANSQKDHAAGIRTVLARQLTEATLRAESATMEFSAVTSDIPSSIPQSDGTQRIHSASRALGVARDEMMRAHRRMNEFLENGVVPDDLKRSR